MEYKDQILFIVFAAIKYAFAEDLIFFLEDEPDATSEDVIDYVIDMTHECQVEAEKNSNSLGVCITGRSQTMKSGIE